MPLRGTAPVIAVPAAAATSTSYGARISFAHDYPIPTAQIGSGSDPVPWSQVDFDNGGYTKGVLGELTIPTGLAGPYEVGVTMVLPRSTTVPSVFDLAIYRGYVNEQLWRGRFDLLTENSSEAPIVLHAYAGPYIFAEGDRINVFFLPTVAATVTANDATYGPSFFWLRYLCV